MENKKLMAMARESLSGKWGLAVGTFLVYGLVVAAAGSNGIAVLLIGGPMLIGLAIFSLTIARNQDAKLEQIFEGFKKKLRPSVRIIGKRGNSQSRFRRV